MIIYQQPAYVLHSRPYRETSLLLTFFTPEQGKQLATVRGVRSNSKAARQKQAWLQPFQPLQLQWRGQEHTNSEWINPQSFEPQGQGHLLTGEANLCGLYLNELLYRLLQPCSSMEGLFDSYQNTLRALAATQERALLAWYLRQFELALLTDLGYELDLSQDAQHQPIDQQACYGYQYQVGLVRLDKPQPTEWHLSGDCVLKLIEQEFCPNCLSAWKQLMRRVLQPHLGIKPLATRQLFKSL